MHLARMGRTFKKQVSVIWSSRMYTPKEFVGANWICVRCVHRTSSWYISGGSEQSMEAQGPFSHLSYREIGSEKNIQKQHDPAKWMTPKKERKKNRKTERNKHSVPPKSPYSFVHFLPKKNRFLPHIQPILINGSEVSNNAMRTSTGMKQPTWKTHGCLKAGCLKKINQSKKPFILPEIYRSRIFCIFRFTNCMFVLLLHRKFSHVLGRKDIFTM